jgi:hypothetical protein
MPPKPFAFVIKAKDVARAREVYMVRHPGPAHEIGERHIDWEMHELRSGDLRFAFASSERCALFCQLINYADPEIEPEYDPPLRDWPNV